MSRRQGTRGVSLVELMIGMALGLVLVVVMLQGLVSTQSSARANNLVAEYRTNGRYALETLRRELRHAAMSPLLWNAGQIDVSAAAAARNFGCGAGLATALRQGVLVTNDSNPFATSCLATGTDRDWLQGDVLVLRRMSMAPVATFTQGAPYARVSYGAGQVFLGGEAPLDLPQPRFDHAVVHDVYYINRFSFSADENPRVPALYRLTLGTGINPTLQPELVAANVEQLQVELAVTDAAGSLRWLAPNLVTDWAAVSAVRLWLVSRAAEPEAGFSSGSFALGTVNFAPADSFRRVLLSTTVNLRNR